MASQASAALPRCSAEGCTNEAPFACPTCKKLGLTEGIAFCGKECFKLSWTAHKKAHAMPPPQPTAPAPTSATARAPIVAPQVAKSEASAASQPSLNQKVCENLNLPKTEQEWYEFLRSGGRECESEGNLPCALDVYRHAMRLQVDLCDEGRRPTKDLAESHYNVSRLLLKPENDLSDFDEAYAEAVEAVDTIKKSGAEKDATYAAIYVNLAEAATVMERPKKAIEAYKKAIAVFEALEGPDSEAVSLTHCNLGYAYKNKRDYKEAMHHYLECLHIQERTNKVDTILGAAIHQNIGKLYHIMGDLDNAQKFLERALELRIRVLGPDHSDVGVSACSIGEVYTSRNNLAKALEYYQKDLEVTEKAFGRNHSAVAAAHMNVSSAYRMLDNIPLALEHCKVAAEIGNEVLSERDTDLWVITMELNLMRALSGDLDKALRVNQRIRSHGVMEIRPWATKQGEGISAAIKAKTKDLNAIKRVMETHLGNEVKSAYAELDADTIFKRTSANAVLPQHSKAKEMEDPLFQFCFVPRVSKDMWPGLTLYYLRNNMSEVIGELMQDYTSE